jgi:hypothetical protein
VSDAAFLVIVGLMACAVGYIVFREVTRGEFRREGMNGWFRRKENPRDYIFHVACHAAILLMILWVFAWTLLGKPKL